MKAYLDCIPCFLKQTLEAARMVTDDEHVQESVLKEVMDHFQTISFDKSPPEISRLVHEIIRRRTQSEDPYKTVKNQSNEQAKQLYPHLKSIVDAADDQLLMAIKLAIVGNVVDFGTSNRFNLEEMIDTAVKKEFATKAYSRFTQVLDQAHTILYIADNTGEIFFDKLLIEELVKREKTITYVVKSHPIINDAMVEDACYAGIDNLATVIEGDAGQELSGPGMIPPYVSKEFMQLFHTADMIISKGQGNYESLSDSDREIFFLLMIKCPLIARDTGFAFASMVLKDYTGSKRIEKTVKE